MNIKITCGTTRDDYDWEEMEINGKNALSVYPLCESLEDAVIGRGLVSCEDVVEFMRQAWEAGKVGELFVAEYIVEDEEEE